MRMPRMFLLLVAFAISIVGSAGPVMAQDADVDDLEATVEAIETRIAEIRLDDVPEVDEIDQDAFDELVAEIKADDPVFGPESGEIVHDPEFIRLWYASGYHENFLLEATFGNPYEEDGADFDFGIEFRISGNYMNPSRGYLIVDSSDNWVAAIGTDEEWSGSDETTLADGRFRAIDTDAGGENSLTLLV